MESREQSKSTTAGIKEIFKILTFKEIFISNWYVRIPIFLSIGFGLMSILCNINSYLLIIEIKDIMLSFLPSILGFTLAGYVLIVGFLQTDLLKFITRKYLSPNYSIYQETSAIFAINIILQSIALVFGYLFHFIIFIGDLKNTLIASSLATFINFIGLIIISYWFLISISMIFQIIVNIFNFSQLHQYFLNKKDISDKNPMI